MTVCKLAHALLLLNYVEVWKKANLFYLFFFVNLSIFDSNLEWKIEGVGQL